MLVWPKFLLYGNKGTPSHHGAWVPLSQYLFTCLLITKNQVRVTSLSRCVTKILTLHGMSKIDFQPDFLNSQMLSFLMMYNTMGSKVDGLAVREHFLSKNALKTPILAAMIPERLTSEKGRTQNYSTCVQKKLKVLNVYLVANQDFNPKSCEILNLGVLNLRFHRSCGGEIYSVKTNVPMSSACKLNTNERITFFSCWQPATIAC